MAAMDLYRRLAGADFGGNMFVEHARDYQGHNLPLTCGQCVVALVQIIGLGLLLSCLAVSLQSLLNRVQQILIPKGLRQKLDRARFKSFHRHWNVAVRGDKDDRDFNADFRQLSLKIESTHLGQSYIQNQTTRVVGGALPSQKLVTSSERLGAETNGLNEILHRLTHADIVIDDKHGRNDRGFHAGASVPPGRVKWKVAPGPLLAVAHTRPPYDSTIERVIVSPIPVPCGFVV